MSAINRATKHYAAQERLIIAVSEWGDEAGPLEIHVFPMTMAEVNLMQKIASKKASNIEQAANIIVVKAKDKEGKRLFTVTDRDKLMQEADYRVVSRIAEKIEDHFFGDVETQKGNLGATQPDATS
ncbi:hypothetical protein N9W34_00275 [Rickettsiales bacterium]|nr:hypothetical protein [Rickettsiales bacterium]